MDPYYFYTFLFIKLGEIIACIFIILFRLGRIWSSPDIVVGLARLSWLLGVVLRRRPCTRRAGSGYKVRRYSGAVSII